MHLYTKFAVSTCVCCCHTVVVSRSMMLESFYFSVYSSVEACQICHKFALSRRPQRKSLIATSLIVVVSLFVVVVNYSEKPYFLLQPVFGQTFSSHWMFSKQPYKAFKPHLGYVSIPKQEVRDTHINTLTCQHLYAQTEILYAHRRNSPREVSIVILHIKWI